MVNATSDNCVVHGLTGEQGSFLQQYGILFSNTSTRVPTGWTIDACALQNFTNTVAVAGSAPVLDNFKIRGVTEITSHGICIPGTLQNSTVDCGAESITIGTSQRNCLIGFLSNMSITTRVKDIVLDTFTGAASFGNGIGVYGNTAPALVGGFGTPTGNTVVANFPGATATLLQTSQSVAEILTILKGIGLIGG